MTESNPFQTPGTDVEQANKIELDKLDINLKTLPTGNGINWIVDGFKNFMISPFTWVLVFFVYMLIIMALSMIPIVSMLTTIIIPIFTAGFMICAHENKLNRTFLVKHLFDAFSMNGLRLSLLGLINFIIMAIFTIVVIALSAVVIINNADSLEPLLNVNNINDIISSIMLTPEIKNSMLTLILIFLISLALVIPVLMAFWFAPALIVFHDIDLFTSMKLSFNGVLKNMLPFLSYSVVYLIIYIIAAIPIIVLAIMMYNEGSDIEPLYALSLGSLIFLLGLLEIFILAPAYMASIFASYEDIYL